MEDNLLTQLKEKLKTSKEVAIIPHRNPDGDAMGSTLGLRLFLKSMGMEATVISPNKYPHFLQWLPGNDSVIFFDKEVDKAQKLLQNADLIFTLDFNSFPRTGKGMGEFLESCTQDFVMIDHHQQPDDYAKFIYSDIQASSTCELVYNFIEKLGKVDQITAEMATCLYTGIMTDTGSFRFASTSSRTHRIIAELMDRGAKNAWIHQQVLDTRSVNQLQLLGTALSNLTVVKDKRTAYITLSQKELDTHHFKKGDTEGFVNYGLSLAGIIFAVIFIENREEGIVKISFRSKGDFDVNTFARRHFNGGGHINAAGGRSEESLEETKRKFEQLLVDYQDELKCEAC